MILASVILLPLLVISLWVFVRAYPKGQSGEVIRWFNITTLVVIVASCFAVSVYFWQTTGQSVDRAWWPVLALFGSVVVTIVVLAVAALVRLRLFGSKIDR